MLFDKYDFFGDKLKINVYTTKSSLLPFQIMAIFKRRYL